MTVRFWFLAALLTSPALAQYDGWRHGGSLWVLTTPDGADLPASASEDNFPLLVRLHRDWFDFAQARPGGEDVRFATTTGQPLPYQIEEWDPGAGVASIWVRLPSIKGNARQELRMLWGKADAASESNGPAVFGAANGYLSVWHLTAPVRDEVGTLTCKDVGTSACAGVVGPARRFGGGQGIFGGDQITGYPTGADPHSTEAWVRAERVNTNPINWGNEPGQGGKVRFRLASPPRIQIECNFANVDGQGAFPLGEWVHVVHTYSRGDSRVYVNGKLDGAARPLLNIKSPARLWLGGWYHQYNYLGELDEVRVSKVTRSADWVRLCYANQHPLQSLVGPLVPPGNDWGVTPAQATVREGGSVTFTARAGGARKLSWLVKRAGREQVVAVDRLTYTFPAGRVTGDEKLTLALRAIDAQGTKTIEIPVTIQEAIAEPVVTLSAPAQWDGRQPITVSATVANRAALEAQGAGQVSLAWEAAGLAVAKETAPGKLLLTRAQNSGTLTVTVTADNGGTPTRASTTLQVREPATDAYIARTPGESEAPEDHQFFARERGGDGTLWYAGQLAEPAEAVFAHLYAEDKLVGTSRAAVGPDRRYRLAVRLKPGLIHYRTEFGAKTAAGETVVHRASDLVCGDVYLLDGQSNTVATDFGRDDPPPPSEWVRSFGTTAGDPRGARTRLWANAVARGQGGAAQIGYWALLLGKRLVEAHQIPICLINGAVGGTRVDQHQRNPADPEDASTIYGRLLWRVRQAKLTHGVRAVLWHQGENDQGADGPTGRWGWETYREFFIDMAAGWQQDYPNVERYYVFQIWPRACAMGSGDSDNMLREVQRTLPRDFARLSVMSTLGIKPPGGCHYPAAGYAEMARLVAPLLQQWHYGLRPGQSITPPDLVRAAWVDARRDRLALTFDQPVVWNDALTNQFYLDGARDKVASGAVAGNTLTLTLREPSPARTVTYLDSRAWNENRLLLGANGIAALTFCQVPIQ